MTAASTEEYSANILYASSLWTRIQIQDENSSDRKQTDSEWDVCSNNDRDGVRLHGYTPLSTQHPTHPATVQNGSNSKLFKTNCVSRLKDYAEKFTLILYFLRNDEMNLEK